MSVAFEGIKEDNYRMEHNGHVLQAIRYDRANTELFPDGYLGKIYQLCRASRRRSGDGILTAIFGGNPDSSFESIVSYLAARPAIVVLGEWTPEGFVEGGFAFPLLSCGVKPPELAAFCGYGFFKHTWGTEELQVMAMLGLTYLFQEFGLKAIHGTRYESNVLTANFLSQFGFKDVGRIPEYQLKDGVLVPAIVSTLLRKDFEGYVENFLVEQYRAELRAEPEPQIVQQEPEKPKDLPQMSLSWL